MHVFLRRFALVMAALFFAGQAQAQAPAWQKQWADTVARAKGQTLVITVHPNAANADVLKVFQKRFPGIKVQVSQMSANRFAPRIISEQKAGIYAWDAWLGTTANMNDLILPMGGFASLDSYLVLPEVKDPAAWRSSEFLYTSPKAHAVLISSLPYSNAVFVNTDRLGGIKLNTAEDLLSPALKGKIAIRDPSRPNAGGITLGGIIKPMGPKGPDFLRRLYAQSPAVMDNPRQIANAVMRGDKAVAIGAPTDVISKCQMSGGCKNVKTWVVGAPILLPRGVAIMKNAPHKDAVTVWLNWFLSKEGQEAYVATWAKEDISGAVSQRKDVKPHPSLVATMPNFSAREKLMLSGMGTGDEEFTFTAMKVYTAFKTAGR